MVWFDNRFIGSRSDVTGTECFFTSSAAYFAAVDKYQQTTYNCKVYISPYLSLEVNIYVLLFLYLLLLFCTE